MNSISIFTKLAYQQSERLTRAYSTSFSSAITLLDKPLQKHIYAIYGLVRLADEIVDSFRPEDMHSQLDKLESEVHQAIITEFSTNMLVYAFALTANIYHIEKHEIKAFFNSMRADISSQTYTDSEYKNYIYGSAQVVGLMCLHIFCANDPENFNKFGDSAKALGAAFQKINFLRDIAADHNGLGRMYFPGVDFNNFNNQQKSLVIRDIKSDLRQARRGLLELPQSSKYGVLLALYYYESLLKKLSGSTPRQITTSRIRISDPHKFWLYLLVRLQKISHS